jgi:glutamyl-tRNA synthetase
MVVTRFAPSPTGALHIGGARTALFSWAYARHHGGVCYLRIEDTDQTRSTEASDAMVLESLEWLGISFDPPPGGAPLMRQSERLPRYSEAVEALLAAGQAYRCVCPPEALAAMRERGRQGTGHAGYDGTCRDKGIGPEVPGACIRMRVDRDAEPSITRWRDVIAGPSGQELELIDDFVLVRADGTPIYHFAATIDDHDMGITHVIRGREHMTSTPRQLLIYRALGYDAPAFGHVPLLVDASGKKLSKRVGDVSVTAYRDAGYPREAVVNFIARLGWSHGDLEVFSVEQLVELFDLRDVGRAPSQVDVDKLAWLSQTYIQSLPDDTLFAYARPFLERVAGHPLDASPSLYKLMGLLRARSKTFADMAERARFALCDDIEIDPKAGRKFLAPASRPILIVLRDTLAEIPEERFSADVLEQAFERVVAAQSVTLGQLAQPARVAVVGGSASPGIYDTLELAGRRRTLARLERALTYTPEPAES